MATIEAARLSKRYGARTALDELTFSARPGEIVGLLGPNGAGKTTTIRLLTTILRPTSGTFTVNGVPGNQTARIREHIGVLPESAGYPEHQTGADYLRYAARLFGATRRQAETVADRLLGDVGLAQHAGRPISTYSRGLRQRLGIARALVNDPAVVFLDEPTLGLDPAGQREILTTIRRIAAERGATVVLSTHLLPEVEEVCTTLLILDHGRLLAAGSVEEVTRSVGVHRTGLLRVPPGRADYALQVLRRLRALSATVAPDRPDTIELQAETIAWNDVLRALIAAEIPVLGFEADSTSFSDAFLDLTREASS
ncbi:ABC transporter ATP-binding protein [Kribbella sp. NPDC003557]|uniref:ABC transporter ATP-binding protein n=1 Tax=Kribbella sp. NPDC003557 TaxID=3154449 RepID=UPI00339E0EB5